MCSVCGQTWMTRSTSRETAPCLIDATKMTALVKHASKCYRVRCDDRFTQLSSVIIATSSCALTIDTIETLRSA
jgi:hypothetical protein